MQINGTGEIKLTGSCLPRNATLPTVDNSNPLSTSFVYLPPEVLAGGLYIAPADIYSFALLCIEIKNHQYLLFREFRSQPNFSVEIFQKISVKSSVEEDILALPFPSTFSKQKLHMCLDPIESVRPTAVALAREFDNMSRLTRKTSSTPGSIFRRATKKIR